MCFVDTNCFFYEKSTICTSRRDIVAMLGKTIGWEAMSTKHATSLFAGGGDVQE
jgi:hypothetical protein